MDIRADGTLDYTDEVLSELDVVIASVHSALGQERSVITARVVAAMRNPHVPARGPLTPRLVIASASCRGHVVRRSTRKRVNPYTFPLGRNRSRTLNQHSKRTSLRERQVIVQGFLCEARQLGVWRR